MALSSLAFMLGAVSTVGAMMVRRAALHTPPRARKIPHDVLFGAVVGVGARHLCLCVSGAVSLCFCVYLEVVVVVVGW
jgi:hypothetical protein